MTRCRLEVDLPNRTLHRIATEFQPVQRRLRQEIVQAGRRFPSPEAIELPAGLRRVGMRRVRRLGRLVALFCNQLGQNTGDMGGPSSAGPSRNEAAIPAIAERVIRPNRPKDHRRTSIRPLASGNLAEHSKKVVYLLWYLDCLMERVRLMRVVTCETSTPHRRPQFSDLEVHCGTTRHRAREYPFGNQPTRFELTADGLLTRIVGPKAPSDSGTVARIARPILLSAIARDETDDCR